MNEHLELTSMAIEVDRISWLTPFVLTCRALISGYYTSAPENEGVVVAVVAGLVADDRFVAMSGDAFVIGDRPT